MKSKRLLNLISALGIFIVIVISFYVVITQSGINADETVPVPSLALPTIDDLSNLSIGQDTNLQGKRLFPADNYWNWDISKAPADPNSDEYISHLWSGGAPLHPDFGPGTYGIPYNIVSGSQPKVAVTISNKNDSYTGPYPIPDNPLVEGGGSGAATSGDRHLLMLDKDNRLLYELYGVQKTDAGWTAGSGMVWDLNSSAMFQKPFGATSSDGAGLAVMPGLVTYNEAVNNTFNHAFRFTINNVRAAYTPPASHLMDVSSAAYQLSAGTRLRLKANFDVSKFYPENQAILNALKKYGMILADNGGELFLTGATDQRWSNDRLNQLKTVTASAFEVVKMGPVMVNYPTAQPTVPTDETKPLELVAQFQSKGTGCSMASNGTWHCPKEKTLDTLGDGWNETVYFHYGVRTTLGSGGVTGMVGDFNYDFRGVTGSPHTFLPGDQIIATYYYFCPTGWTCPDTREIDSWLNVTALNNRDVWADARFWDAMGHMTIQINGYAKAVYTFTAGATEGGIKAGTYSQISLNAGHYQANLVLSKIELGRAAITDSTPMWVDISTAESTVTKDYVVARQGKHDINVVGSAGDYSVSVDGAAEVLFSISSANAGSTVKAANILLTTGPHKLMFNIKTTGAKLDKFQATSAHYVEDPDYPIDNQFNIPNPAKFVPSADRLGGSPTPTPTPVPTPTSVPTSTPIAVNNPPPVSTPTPIPVSNPTPESTPPSSLSSPVSEPAPAVDPPSIVSSVATTVSNVVSAVVETITSVFSPSVETPLIVPSTPNSTQFGALTYPTITKDLTYRSRDTQVTKVNEILAFVGYSTNANANYFSLTTKYSLRTFQRRNGIYKIGKKIDPEYGIVGSKTRAALNRYISEIEDTKLNPENHIPVYLRYGQRGGGALALNRTFRKLGYLKNGEVYVFNSKTRAALQTFQKANNLKKTTKLNSETLNKLRKKAGK